MRNKYMNEGCASCAPDDVGVKREVNPGLITTALLVILPKCPFCVLAYSSTLVMCGKDSVFTDVRHHQSGLTIAITACLSLLVLLSIAFNYRDKRSTWSLLIIAMGSALALWSTAKGGGEFLYYIGVFTIALGVWLNGSLMYVWRRVTGFFRSAMSLRLGNGLS